MCEPEARWPENVPGPFFVDAQCIACGICVTEAPPLFSMNIEKGYAYVSSRPRGQEEIKLFLLASDLCPVSAIGVSD